MVEIKLKFVEQAIQTGFIYGKQPIFITQNHAFTTLKEAQAYRDASMAEMLQIYEHAENGGN